MLLYKILAEQEWRTAVEAGVFHGSNDDRRDGFVHLSTAAQVAGTLARHFAGRADLIVVAIEKTRLGGDLRWEISRGGALFPHLYAPLPTADVAWSRPLPLDDNGSHRLPPEVV